jgi:hypothetical protein
MREFLPGRPLLPYIPPMDEMSLPPELETLLRERDAARAAFLASVLAADDEADRNGCVSGEEMIARVRARLADKHSAAV